MHSKDGSLRWEAKGGERQLAGEGVRPDHAAACCTVTSACMGLAGQQAVRTGRFWWWFIPRVQQVGVRYVALFPFPSPPSFRLLVEYRAVLNPSFLHTAVSPPKLPSNSRPCSSFVRAWCLVGTTPRVHGDWLVQPHEHDVI